MANIGGTDKFAREQMLIAGMNLPVLRYRRWDASLGLGSYRNEDSRRDPFYTIAMPARYERYGLMSSFGLQLRIGPAIGPSALAWIHSELQKLAETGLTNGRSETTPRSSKLATFMGYLRSFM